MRSSRTEDSGEDHSARGGFLERLFRRITQKMAYYFKRYGWKVGVLIFVYYLVRDTFLYIVLPILIAKKIAGG